MGSRSERGYLFAFTIIVCPNSSALILLPSLQNNPQNVSDILISEVIYHPM